MILSTKIIDNWSVFMRLFQNIVGVQFCWPHVDELLNKLDASFWDITTMSPAWRNYGVFMWIQSCLTWISGWILLPAVSLIIVLFSSTCCPSWDDLVKLIATLIKYNFVVFCVNFSVCCFTDMTLGTCISDCAIAHQMMDILNTSFLSCVTMH